MALTPQPAREQLVGSGSRTGVAVPVASLDPLNPIMLDAGTGDASVMRRVWVYVVNTETAVRHKLYVMFGDRARIIPFQVLPDIGVQTAVTGLPLQDN